MTALLLGLLWKFSGYIIAGVGALIGFLAWRTRERGVGAAKERAKQAEAEAKARDIADQVDNDLTLLTPEQKRKELGEWSPKS